MTDSKGVLVIMFWMVCLRKDGQPIAKAHLVSSCELKFAPAFQAYVLLVKMHCEMPKELKARVNDQSNPCIYASWKDNLL